jgi:hypothetical protein
LSARRDYAANACRWCSETRTLGYATLSLSRVAGKRTTYSGVVWVAAAVAIGPRASGSALSIHTSVCLGYVGRWQWGNEEGGGDGDSLLRLVDWNVRIGKWMVRDLTLTMLGMGKKRFSSKASTQ